MEKFATVRLYAVSCYQSARFGSLWFDVYHFEFYALSLGEYY
jgi:hypothetical protein